VPLLAWILIPLLGLAILQALVLWLAAYENCRFFRSQVPARPTGTYTPPVRLIVPCKGVETHFDDTIHGLLSQDYPKYAVTFVVESPTDPAYHRLNRLVRDHERPARVIAAGESRGCGQKVQNLIAATARLPADVDVVAFADSDAVPDSGWLRRLIYPLHDRRRGAVTGYRWFVPTAGNWPGIVLTAMNASIAMLCGNHPFNVIWGGGWAIRRPLFERLLDDGYWHGALTEDLPATVMLHRVGARIAYAPGCLVASPVECSWPWLLSFGRRQYMLLRVYLPGLWAMFVASALLFQITFWGGLAAVAFGDLGRWRSPIAAVLAVVYLANALRAAVRQRTVARQHPLSGRGPWWAAVLDVVAHPLLNLGHLISLVSSAGHTTTWRGIRYRLHGPHRTEVLERPPVADLPPGMSAAA
jgi:hypothetical protein